MKRYMVKEECADRIFGGEVETEYVDSCVRYGMPEKDVKFLVQEWGEEVLDCFYIIEEGGEMTKWYAVMQNAEDDDWGTGSYCYDEAVCMAKKYGPDAYIAVIEEGTDKVCVEEIHDLPEARDLDELAYYEMNDGELITYIDDQPEFDADSMTELVKRANIYDEESGILARWNAEPDGEHDIQDFFDEACDIIRAFHKQIGR